MSLRMIGTLIAFLAVAMPVKATTMIRQDVGRLTAANSNVLLGEVVSGYSHWGSGGISILTEVRIRVNEVFKGEAQPGSEINVTILGGTVGDLTTLIPGGAQLLQGRKYVLFLNERNLPGAKGALTVPYLSQGVFEVVHGSTGLRAVSQANQHALLPDRSGVSEAPGGRNGLPLEEMQQLIRAANQGELK